MATSYPPTLDAIAGSAGGANLQSLLLLFLAQLQNAHNSTMARFQAELQQEREKYLHKMTKLAAMERDLAFEVDRQRLQVQNLLEQKEEYQKQLEKMNRDLEVRENIISRLENEKSSLTTQLQNPILMERLVEEVQQNLTGSVIKELRQNQQQQQSSRKRRAQQEQPPVLKKATGYFLNDTLNHYVWNIPDTCEEELYILDSYLKRIPTLLTGKTVEVALLEVTKLNQIHEMEVLLATGVPIDKLTADSRTLLWWAAHNGHVAACQVLLSHGARTNAISPGWISSTALHVAAWNGHTKVVQLLVENGGDIETKSSESQTVIFYAARRGQVNIVKYLVEQGADLEARDLNGKTAIEVATAPVAQWFKTWLSEKNESGK